MRCAQTDGTIVDDKRDSRLMYVKGDAIVRSTRSDRQRSAMPVSVVAGWQRPRDCSRGQPENSEHECEIVIAMSALGDQQTVQCTR